LRDSSTVRPRGDNVGSRQSRQRARGIDFEEVRLYQQGDDVRTIDWRVTARTSIPHTKIFRAERDRPVFTLVDQRQSMFFGSRMCCKSVQAAHLAALIAWGAYHRGDQTGGYVLAHSGYRETRLSRGYQTVLQFLHQVNTCNNDLNLGVDASKQADLVSIFGKLRKSMRPGSMLFIISDANDLDVENKQLTAHLHDLVRHCELRWLHVSDLMERHMPTQGRYLFTNGDERYELRLSSPYSKAYSQSHEQRMTAISDYLSGLRIPLTKVDTTDVPIKVLTGGVNTQQL
jgi:uncharacterized protein (DUF58 family)